MAQKRQSSRTETFPKRSRNSESQSVNSQNSQEKDEAEVGIVESVSVKNFMCHDHLDFKFGPHVNFIIGRNGSGKSAILTAIVVGLGGKANVTGRATNLKGFIKNGKQTAETTIKIRNCGPDAYKTEEYGSSIIVERRITSDGSSSYKLKSDSGVVVSTKREELVHIMDQFNIQIDNPVSVLNQETSRSFLNSKSSKDKYKFFLKATQLDQMKKDYTQTDETEKVIRHILHRKKETLPELEKEVNEWKQKWEFYQSLKKQQDKLSYLRNEFAWAYVAVKERELNEKLRKLEEQKNNTPRFRSKVQESQEKLTEKLSEKHEIENKLKKIKEETHILQPQHIEARNKLDNKNKLFNNKKLELRKAEKEISSLEKEISGLKKRIEELRMGGQKDYAAERQKRAENLKLLEEEKTRLLTERKNIEFNQQKLDANINKSQEEMHNLREQDRNVRQQLESLHRVIMNLESSRTNQLRRFGHYMPELLDRIDRYHKQNKFKQKPVGPIGVCIKLKDAKWALAVESCLKNLVFAFCCDNHEDERILQQIMKASCNNEERKPSIIVSKFCRKIYDVSRYCVRSDQYSSILQMLDIIDPVVANCLIDQCSIESILLIEDNREARNVMLDNPPHNCHEAFTLVGDQLYASPFRYYSNLKKTADYLQGSVEDKIREKKEEIEYLKSTQEKLQADINKITQILNSNQAECNKLSAAVQKNHKSVAQINLKITELKNAEEPEPIDAKVLEEELETMYSQIMDTKQKEDILREEYRNADIEVKKANEEYNERDTALNLLLNNIEPLKDSLRNVDSYVDQAKVHKQHYEKKLKEHERIINDLDKEYQASKAVYELDVTKAEQISPKIETNRTPYNIEMEINQIEKHLRLEEERRGSREEVNQRYSDTKQKYDQIKSDIKLIENFTEKLNSVMVERKQAYSKFRQQLSLRVRYLFITALSQRNYSGKIDFDHKKESLEIKIQPNSNVVEMNEDMKSLSGGERSFTTVCLILALWDAVESPFRILDEYDVFMDMINRRISMDMMIETAAHKTKHQFIFLTPLSMSNLKISRSIQICRMPDPDRKQNSQEEIE